MPSPSARRSKPAHTLTPLAAAFFCGIIAFSILPLLGCGGLPTPWLPGDAAVEAENAESLESNQRITRVPIPAENVPVVDTLKLVGDIGNAPLPYADLNCPGSSGRVSYSFYISAVEVTNEDYATFLNAVASKNDPGGLYDDRMGFSLLGGIQKTETSAGFVYSIRANMTNKPVNFISWECAAQFCNWLQHGRPTGPGAADATLRGTYDLTLDNPYLQAVRAPGAVWALPSGDEWIKAALFDPTRPTADKYWTYATRSDVAPIAATASSSGVISNPGPNVVNYLRTANWNGATLGDVTSVGSAGAASASYYGLMDMHGNVGEWSEKIDCADPVGRYILGGSYYNMILTGPIGAPVDPNHRAPTIGFRIVFIPG